MKKHLRILALFGALGVLAVAATIGTLGSLPDAGAGVFTQQNHDQINTNTTTANTNFANVNAALQALGSQAPVACGSTCTAIPGELVLLNTAAGSTVTIPTSSGSGNVIRMRITVATSSLAEKVLLATIADAIIGTAIGENAGTAKVFVGNAGTFHSLQMPFSGSQPSGGFIGDAVTCTDIAAGTWACDVTYQAGTTPTTPYSTATT